MNVPIVTWTVEWPAQGTLEMFISGFKMWVSVRIFGADVHLSFDRCRDYSTKSKARFAQATATRFHQLVSTPHCLLARQC